MPLKRYLLFCGDDYYPAGGWDDFVGSFDTKDEADDAAAQLADANWHQIIDAEEIES
jgi:hypothetical protein